MKRTPLLRKERIKAVSKKTAKIRRDAKPARDAYLSAHPRCEFGIENVCTGTSEDVHERLRRSQGGDIAEPTVIAAICRACHTWVHDHPNASYAAGWLRRRWSA